MLGNANASPFEIWPGLQLEMTKVRTRPSGSFLVASGLAQCLVTSCSATFKLLARELSTTSRQYDRDQKGRQLQVPSQFSLRTKLFGSLRVPQLPSAHTPA